jgi:hypothetical protein
LANGLKNEGWIGMEVAFRAFNAKRQGEKPRSDRPRQYDEPSYERILVFDTETRSDEKQSLTFGSFVIMHGDLVERLGIFYNPVEVTKGELEVLQDYCNHDPTIKLYDLGTFIERVFYPTVYRDQVPCIGFNLPFDISRLAIDYGHARGWMKGGFTFRLSEERKHPAIRVKHISSAESCIEFHTTQFSKFRGYFIDCQNLAIIFSDNKHISLKEACKRYNKKHQKLEAGEHGRMTSDYVAYNIEDTLCTAELFTHLKSEYDRFGVKLPLPDVFSSASIGKAFLEQLGITPYMNLNPDVLPEIYGKIAMSYYGGRVECRVRKQPCLVTALDFTSMYPTLFTLLGLYDFLIAEKIEHVDDTENVQKLINEIKLEDLRNPDTWKRLSVIVEIEPKDDLLPVRAAYNEDNFTVGLNHVSSKKAVYYALPSIILSKLLTGKAPIIKTAIRFKPVGKQKTLKKTNILGMDIDPAKDNIFKILVEEKQRSKKAKDRRDRQIKILVNATSYGIYIELNPEDEKSDIMVYSGNEKFQDFKRVEREGRHFNPIISTLITDGAKLFLGIGDCILGQHGEVMAYSDTDSMDVPPKYTKEIIEFFDPLNPYDNKLIDNILKVEEESIWLYGISAKRYVLYDVDGRGDFIIKDDNYSLHGLGHLTNPFGKETKNWQKEIWLDMLRLEYGQARLDDVLDKYRSFYAIAQFTVTTPNLMNRFRLVNRGKQYNGIIKPFNFFLIGFGNMKEIKPVAPFSRDPQTMPYSKFINYKTGELMEGQQYFKSLSDEILHYINHPESKLIGDIGILQRRHIGAESFVYIGKEADKIEESLSGLGKMTSNTYNNPKDMETILSLPWEEVKRCGIPKSQFYALKKQLKEGKRLKLSSKTLSRLRTLSSPSDLL